MIAAIDATGSGPLTKAGVKWVTHGFLPTYASPVMDRERLYTVDNSAILGAFDLKTRQGSLDEAARHRSEGLATAGRRQAVRRHRGRQVLHPAANGDRRGNARRGSHRHGDQSRTDRGVTGGRRRPDLCDDDVAGRTGGRVGGTSVRDRPEGADARGDQRPPRRRRRHHPRRAVAQVQVFPYEALLDHRRQAGVHPEAVRRQGQLHPHRAGKRSAVDARSARRNGRRRRRLRGAGHRIGRIREGHRRRRQRTGARARDSAAAVDARFRRDEGGADVVDVQPEGRARPPWMAAA